MDFKPVTMHDHARVTDYTARWHFDDCAPTLASMLLWAPSWGISLCEEDDALYIMLQHAGGKPLMGQPIPRDPANAAQAASRALEEMRQRGLKPVLRGCNQAFCQALGEAREQYDIQPFRDAFEYIYSIPDLITLSGRRYHQKRNHIARFNAAHTPVWHEFSAADAGAALAFFDRWTKLREPSEALRDERLALESAFAHWDFLGLRGAWLELEGGMAAFTVSGMLHPDLAVIHFEKADTRYEGIYAAMNQGYLERYLNDVAEVNRQEDMGVPGLRRAKLSYHPARFAEKFLVSPV